MKVLRNIFVGLAGLVILAAAVGFILPGHVRVERKIAIEAPPRTVFTILNTLKAAERWSPWLHVDPQTQLTFEGPPSGSGNVMHWRSDNPSIGEGRQEIIASDEDSFVSTRVVTDAFGENGADFKLVPGATGGTEVTWTFEKRLPANPFAHYFGLLIPSWVGPDYERGLANLKKFAESLPLTDLSAIEVEKISAEARPILALRTQAGLGSAALGRALGAAYVQLATLIERGGGAVTGAPVSITIGVRDGQTLIDAGLPVPPDFQPTDLPANFSLTATPSGPALKVVHVGAYDTLEETYKALLTYALATGETITGSSWSEYVGDPATTRPEDLRTLIYLPVK